MAKSKQFVTKTTVVRSHLLHVPISKKNPNGLTIRDQHLRRLPGTFLDFDEIKQTFKNYNRKNLVYPSRQKLKQFKDADKYDDVIAVWVDYFNKKFDQSSPLDPDVVKALIASESAFRVDPKENKTAFGITQITKETLKVLQDSNGESKEFIFEKIRQKDLKDPDISIPLAIRWLFRKRETAFSKLRREPSNEELILEYKGMLKSNSPQKEKALENFRRNLVQLKKK